jgi:hypothetical protein
MKFKYPVRRRAVLVVDQPAFEGGRRNAQSCGDFNDIQQELRFGAT